MKIWKFAFAAGIPVFFLLISLAVLGYYHLQNYWFIWSPKTVSEIESLHDPHIPIANSRQALLYGVNYDPFLDELRNHEYNHQKWGFKAQRLNKDTSRYTRLIENHPTDNTVADIWYVEASFKDSWVECGNTLYFTSKGEIITHSGYRCWGLK